MEYKKPRILGSLNNAILESNFAAHDTKHKKTRKRDIDTEKKGHGYRIPSQHAEKYISKLTCIRGYKVLGLKSEGNDKVAIDLFTGNKVNMGGKGADSRITNQLKLYETKQAALSEKFPPSQVGSSKSGNGTIPRILVSFDGWGFTKRVYGGIPSYHFEYVRFVRIVECLDPPTIPKRFCEVTAHPYYFGKADKYLPQRERATRTVKAERMLRHP